MNTCAIFYSLRARAVLRCQHLGTGKQSCLGPLGFPNVIIIIKAWAAGPGIRIANVLVLVLLLLLPTMKSAFPCMEIHNKPTVGPMTLQLSPKCRPNWQEL